MNDQRPKDKAWRYSDRVYQQLLDAARAFAKHTGATKVTVYPVSGVIATPIKIRRPRRAPSLAAELEAPRG